MIEDDTILRCQELFQFLVLFFCIDANKVPTNILHSLNHKNYALCFLNYLSK